MGGPRLDAQHAGDGVLAASTRGGDLADERATTTGDGARLDDDQGQAGARFNGVFRRGDATKSVTREEGGSDEDEQEGRRRGTAAPHSADGDAGATTVGDEGPAHLQRVHKIEFDPLGDGSDVGDDPHLDFDGVDEMDEEDEATVKGIYESQPTRWSRDVIMAMVRESGMDPAAPFRAGTAVGVNVKVAAWGPPVRCTQPPMAGERAQAFEKEIAKLLAQGVIVKTDSLYAAPMFVVPKANQFDEDGNQKWRVVLDLHLLNAQFKPMTFVTPTLEEMLREASCVPAGKTRFYAKTDFSCFFHQFRIDPSSQHLFAFRGPTGQAYAYNVLPMGWVHSTAVTAAHMATVMHGFEGFTATVVDDVLLWADTEPELRQRFTALLQRFADFGLQLSVDKIEGGLTQVLFAGHLVAANSLQIAPSKVSAIRQWPAPSTVTQVKQFVGLARWLGNYVHDFETTIAPLERAAKRAKGRVTLTEAELASFDAVKAALCSAPCLVPFDNTLDLDVHIDASKLAGAAILTQTRPGSGRGVVAYLSYKFKPAQQGYPPREIEALSLVKAATRYYRIFLLAKKIVVHTDHQSLAYLMGRSIQSNQRLYRWCCFLSQFKLGFRYIPGYLNVAPDALSRRYLDDADVEPRARPERAQVRQIRASVRSAQRDDIDGVAAHFPEVWVPLLLEQYEADPYFQDVLRVLHGNVDAKAARSETRSRAKRMRLRADGVIVEVSIGGNPRVALPEGSIRDQAVQRLHDVLAHPGPRPLMGVVAQHYFFPNMARVIEAFSRNCTTCLRSKPLTTARGYADAHGAPEARWDEVSMDYATGLSNGPDKPRGAILVVVDALTKRVILIAASENDTASDLVRDFADHVCFKVGFPRLIRIDKGPTFTSKAFRQFCLDHDIEQSFATTSHHVADVERVINTLRTKLRTVSTGEDDDVSWRKHLAAIEFALNSVPAVSDGRSPFQRDLCYAPRLPWTRGDPEATISLAASASRGLAAFPELLDNYNKGKEVSAKQHDKGRVAGKIQVGSKVCVDAKLLKSNIETKGHNRNAKLRPVFSNVVEVLEDLGHGNWRVSRPRGAGSQLEMEFHEKSLKLAGDKTGDGGAPDEREKETRLWPDGSRRVAEVLNSGWRYNKEKVLVRFMAKTTTEWVNRGSLPNDEALIEAYLHAHPTPAKRK